MKVVFLTRRFYPHIGGVEKHILRISQELIKRGTEVTVIAESTNPRDEKATFKGITTDYLQVGPDSWLKKWRIWGEMFKRFRLLQSADVIHTHDVFFWYLPLRFVLFWKPMYTTFHGDEKVFPPRRKAIFLRRIWEALSTKTIDVGSYLNRWYGTSPDLTIWGATDTQKAISSKPNSPLHILLLGRLDPDIAIGRYIELLRYLDEKKLKYSLEVCGDGSLANELKKHGKVHGFVENVEPFIARSDVVFCASYLAILEALAFHKHVVAFYEHPMKKDYLSLSPFAQWLCITDSVELAHEYIEKTATHGFSSQERTKIQEYIDSVSWEQITNQYEALWKK